MRRWDGTRDIDGGDPGDVAQDLARLSLLGVSLANAVWLVERDRGSKRILRLTDPRRRARAENEAEVQLLDRLNAHDFAVCEPIRSRSAAGVETVNVEGLTAWASMFTYVDGIEVRRGTEPYWSDPDFYRAWGAALAVLHRKAMAFDDSAGAAARPRRLHWRDDDLIANAHYYLAADDDAVRAELDEVLGWFAAQPEDGPEFGLTHGDLGPQNFRYTPAGGIAIFDFGNASYHHFAWDVGVALTTIRRDVEATEFPEREWLLEGCRAHRPFSADAERMLPWVYRLRRLYVYLSRRQAFGPEPRSEHVKTLRELRERVLLGR